VDSTEIETPAISIGMPVFNGEKNLAAVLDSLSHQTFRDFELIISDNSSTDATQKICQEYSKKDRRIRVVRQPLNIGASENFSFVLSEARAGYFMWAAADDVRSADFLEVNHQFLECNPDYVSSTSPVRFENGTFDSWKMGDASLVGDTADRISKFLLPWHANGRFYSLVRTTPLKTCPHLRRDFFGSDWAVTMHLLLHGKTNRHASGQVVLGRYGFSNSNTIFRKYRKRRIHQIVPFLEFSQIVVQSSKNFPLPCRLRLLISLAILNIQAICVSAKIEAVRVLKIRPPGASTGESHGTG
jgi:glycosyltransferase involved in cell wall biosynthesis